jgi:hypothetical protein
MSSVDLQTANISFFFLIEAESGEVGLYFEEVFQRLQPGGLVVPGLAEAFLPLLLVTAMDDLPGQESIADLPGQELRELGAV